MRIAIVTDKMKGADAPDLQDALVQARAVGDALGSLGHETARFEAGLDFSALLGELAAFGAEGVFNLVESLEGKGSLIHLPPHLWEARGIPFTGAGAGAMGATSNKTAAKVLMEANHLPTPEWAGPWPGSPFQKAVPENPVPGPWIVKSQWEHASIGLNGESLFTPENGREIASRAAAASLEHGGAFFAERFVDGREFNLSVLAGKHGPRVLPPAEILFEGFGPDRAKIVDYAAKWDESSFAYSHTPRRFDFPESDRGLLDRLSALAFSCWKVFNLAGYARVDFRVDPENRPFILEVNANPCLSPDAGFAAALERAGIPYTGAIGAILADAFPGTGHKAR